MTKKEKYDEIVRRISPLCNIGYNEWMKLEHILYAHVSGYGYVHSSAKKLIDAWCFSKPRLRDQLEGTYDLMLRIYPDRGVNGFAEMSKEVLEMRFGSRQKESEPKTVYMICRHDCDNGLDIHGLYSTEKIANKELESIHKAAPYHYWEIEEYILDEDL